MSDYVTEITVSIEKLQSHASTVKHIIYQIDLEPMRN